MIYPLAAHSNRYRKVANDGACGLLQLRSEEGKGPRCTADTNPTQEANGMRNLILIADHAHNTILCGNLLLKPPYWQAFTLGLAAKNQFGIFESLAVEP